MHVYISSRQELGSRRALVMDYLPGEKMMSSVQRRAAAALGESGYAWARAHALDLPPPPGAQRPTRLQALRAAPALWRLRRQTRSTLATLVKVKGYEIFRVGVFNADPHPGNVLLMPCGRIGLIDYGQVSEVEVDSQIDGQMHRRTDGQMHRCTDRQIGR